MGFFLPLIFFLTLTLLIVIISKHSFGICLPTSVLIATLLPYITGVLFNSLAIGFWLDVALAALGVVSLICLLAFKKYRSLGKEVLGNALSSGLFVFLALYLLVYVSDFQRGFVAWDEFSHWGIMVKDLLSLDRLYCVPEAALTVHRDYPPFMPIFEYVYCRLSGGYEEAYVYRALHFFLLSLCMLPLYCVKNDEKSFARIAIICGSLLGVVFIFLLSTDYDSIYLDLPLGALAGICLYSSIVLNPFKPFDAILLVLLFSAVVLTKQIGVVFFALGVASLSIRGLAHLATNDSRNAKMPKISRKAISRLNSNRRAILCSVCVFVVPAAFYFSWSLFTQHFPVDRQFDTSRFSFSYMLAVFSEDSTLEQWKREGFWNCARFLYRIPLISSSPIELTYVRLVIGIAALAVIAALVVRKNNHGLSRKLCLAAFLVFAGGILYGVVLCFSYTFGFTKNETARVASGERYALTFVIASLIVVYFAIIACFLNRRTKSLNVGAFLLLLLSAFLLVPRGNLPQLIPDRHPGSFSFERGVASEIIEATDPDASTFILMGNGSNDEKFKIAYYAYPRSFKLGTFSDQEGSFSIDEVNALLSEYDYVFVVDPEKDDLSNYQSLFDEEGPIGSGLYSVCSSDGETHLSLIAPHEE